MLNNFNPSLLHVLDSEGGYSDNENDAGGATMHGIIQEEYDAYRRRQGLIPRHVSLITMDEVRDIYKTTYWDKIDGDKLPLGIDYCTFDAAVNSGPTRGIRWLQQAINKCAGKKRLDEDGLIGSITLDAAEDYDPAQLIDAMLDYRLGFMKIARNSKTGKPLWPSFGVGWTNRLFGYLPKGATVRRADGVDDYAKAMIKPAIAIGLPPAGVPALPGPIVTIPIPQLPPPIRKYPLPPAPTKPTAPPTNWIAVIGAALAALIGALLKWPHLIH